ERAQRFPACNPGECLGGDVHCVEHARAVHDAPDLGPSFRVELTHERRERFRIADIEPGKMDGCALVLERADALQPAVRRGVGRQLTPLLPRWNVTAAAEDEATRPTGSHLLGHHQTEIAEPTGDEVAGVAPPLRTRAERRFGGPFQTRTV